MAADEKKFYGMMNDLMFHLVLQESENVLQELVSALMDIPREDIRSCSVENPIDYGKAIDDKKIVLDVRLILNDDTNIDIEVQVRRETYWIERSLLYWAKTFGNLKDGEDYERLRPTCHIGILDFTLFKAAPEFYSEYWIYNKKTGLRYTDKLCMITLDLSRTDLAGNSPKEQKLLKWAKVFKAKTLPELEELCAGEEVLEEMAAAIRKLSADDEIRMQCEAREEYDRRLRSQYKGGYKEGAEYGFERGVKQERKNTEAERLRAERAERLVAEKDKENIALRARIAELERGAK